MVPGLHAHHQGLSFWHEWPLVQQAVCNRQQQQQEQQHGKKLVGITLIRACILSPQQSEQCKQQTGSGAPKLSR
jgi:hypothetical protein